MDPFTLHTGTVAPMDRLNVDTDQIIPKQFLKRIERTGFGQFLFFDWRFLENGSPNPSFILNQPRYSNASILIARNNFGCGSSREHAPWALKDYGFRAVIAPSFAEIFHKNCSDNGIVPVLLPDEQVDQLMTRVKDTDGYTLTIDLNSCVLTDITNLNLQFVIHEDPEIHAFRRHCLLNGLDEIGLTLEHESAITAYEQRAHDSN